jgi:hypothetical protein
MPSAIRGEKNGPATELAAGLTDLALDLLRKAGVGGDSVEMELGLWRALTAGLECELRRRQWARPGGITPLDNVISQVVHRAALDVAAAFAPDRDPADLDVRIRFWVGRLQIPPGLRMLPGKLFASEDDSWAGPRGRSGGVRKLRVTALN